MGTIHELRNIWADSETIELMVIIGIDKPAALNAMALKVGGDVYLDESGAVMKKLGGRGVPHWFVLNSENKVLTHFGGYYSSVDDQLKRMGM
ncbi:MAG TPA: hypothetical protein ENH40_04230 [Nitrospirae bacterium]|nr:hypothetical protein [Nitrospirota bacterium]